MTPDEIYEEMRGENWRNNKEKMEEVAKDVVKVCGMFVDLLEGTLEVWRKKKHVCLSFLFS